MFGLGIQEVIIVGVVAVILFGKRLPEVARSLGTSYREFRQGLGDIQSHMDFSSTTNYRSNSTYDVNRCQEEADTRDEPTAPKFELPSADSSADE